MNKKRISNLLLLVIVLLVSACTLGTPSGNQSYAWEKNKKQPSESTDMVLIYGGGKHRNPYLWEQNRLAPYVTYVDEQGKEHWFFDSFLFIEFRCDTVQHLTGLGMYSAQKRDWQELADYYFKEGNALDALEQSIDEAIQRMGQPSKKRQVVMVIPEPIKYFNAADTTSTTLYWGALEDGKKLDFAKSSDRVAACKWYIDYIRKQFDQKKYKNLDLAGFYWVSETVAQSSEILKDVSEYVKQFNYTMNWIPYYRSEGHDQWKSYGFTHTYYQPNYFFYPQVTAERLDQACKEAEQYQMDMEMEFDGNALDGYGKANRMEEYMAAFKKYGVWEKKRLAYYEGGGGLLLLKNSTNAKDQALYHKFCKFVVERPLRKDR